jgi:hypothetical protein
VACPHFQSRIEHRRTTNRGGNDDGMLSFSGSEAEKAKALFDSAPLFMALHQAGVGGRPIGAFRAGLSGIISNVLSGEEGVAGVKRFGES